MQTAERRIAARLRQALRVPDPPRLEQPADLLRGDEEDDHADELDEDGGAGEGGVDVVRGADGDDVTGNGSAHDELLFRLPRCLASTATRASQLPQCRDASWRLPVTLRPR